MCLVEFALETSGELVFINPAQIAYVKWQSSSATQIAFHASDQSMTIGVAGGLSEVVTKLQRGA